MLTQLEHIIYESYKVHRTAAAVASDLEMEKATVNSILQSIARKGENVAVNNRPTNASTEGRVTNASLVRDQIRDLKAIFTKEEVEEAVIDWCMDVLGQSKQLAKTYFHNNWDKV